MPSVYNFARYLGFCLDVLRISFLFFSKRERRANSRRVSPAYRFSLLTVSRSIVTLSDLRLTNSATVQKWRLDIAIEIVPS